MTLLAGLLKGFFFQFHFRIVGKYHLDNILSGTNTIPLTTTFGEFKPFPCLNMKIENAS